MSDNQAFDEAEVPAVGSTPTRPAPAAAADFGAELAALRGLLAQQAGLGVELRTAVMDVLEALRQLRELALGQQLRPILRDTAALLERVRRVLAAPDADAQAVSALSSVADELEEVLARRDVHRLSIADERFDRSCQRAIAVEETPDPALHLTVARVVRSGYRWGGELLVPEDVVVLRSDRAEGASTS